jgi:hypothetical protein
MSFIQREINRINACLQSQGERSTIYPQLYSAQQALEWVLEPTGVKSPYGVIMGTPEDLVDCLDEGHPPQSSNTCAHCG